MKLLCFSILLVAFSANAQLKGVVIDAETKKPIPYVNIGIVNKNVGTVSLEDGKFEILLDTKYDSDTIRFSSIGYDELSATVKEFRSPIARNHEVGLKPRTILLNEIVINSKPKKVEALGHVPKSRFTKAGFFFNRLGHEIGTLFENTDASIQYLDSVQLNFVTCEYDSIFIRLNVYSAEGEEIRNILPSNILLGMNRKKVLSRPIIDLSQFNLAIGKKFLVSIEIVKDLGASGLKFYAVLKAEKNSTRYRETSQAKWETASHKEKPIGISMLAFVH
jgi:CarboxypepD_reg-like domain